MITSHEALIYAMVLVSAADREMPDRELESMGDMVAHLPVFRDFDRNDLTKVGAACAQLLSEEDGLDKTMAEITAALPRKLHETACGRRPLHVDPVLLGQHEHQRTRRQGGQPDRRDRPQALHRQQGEDDGGGDQRLQRQLVEHEPTGLGEAGRERAADHEQPDGEQRGRRRRGAEDIAEAGGGLRHGETQARAEDATGGGQHERNS